MYSSVKKIFFLLTLSWFVLSSHSSCNDDKSPAEPSSPATVGTTTNANTDTSSNNNSNPGSDDNYKILQTSSESSDVEIAFNINAATTYQTIEGFGASDCWLGEYIGEKFTATQKQELSNLLFSQNVTSDGTPVGIGLSMWRFNLGAGSMEQGDNSGIENIANRAQCFLNNGAYDWTKCSGQVYFLQQAKKLGCEKVVMFSNSPLVDYTFNGQGRSDKGAYANLKEEYYDDYAQYIVDVCKHFCDNGIQIDYISPVNEPQYNWDGKTQEGSGWQNSEVASLTKEINSKIETAGIPTQIILGEAGSFEYLYKNNLEGRSDIVADMFTATGTNYIAGLSHVKPVVCAHSYWIDGSWADLKSSRTSALNKASAQGMGIWQTEYSMLGDAPTKGGEFFTTYDDAKYIDLSLWLSKVIHADMVYANASSWSYWTVFGQERYSQKNRFWLIKVGQSVGDYVEDYTEASDATTYQTGTNLYVLGNYSRFVRPGYVRVDVGFDADSYSKTLFASGYLSPDQSKLVVVYTNMTEEKIRVNPSVAGYEGFTKIYRYVTSADKKLAFNKVSDAKVVLPAKSVVTVVFSK